MMRDLGRLSAIALSGLFLAAALGCGTDEAKPNVVVIVIDTLRTDVLPFHGYDRNTAPLLNRLASEGVVFENTFSTSSWTSPAAASIFTSLYPFQHGVTMGIVASKNAQQQDPSMKLNRIPEAVETLTEMMKKAGYRTFGVSDNLNVSEVEGFEQGFDRFVAFSYEGADVVNKSVKDWAPEIMDSGPYYLYLHYMDPHGPLHERAPWFKEYEASQWLNEYMSEIGYTDHHIQELFDLFGWHENTLVVVTSDHGEEFYDHGLFGHGKSLYNEVIHVPFIVYLPPEERKSGRIKANVSVLDILPTVREFIGLKMDKNLSGISLLKQVLNPVEAGNDRYLFSQLEKKIPGEEDLLGKVTIHDELKFYWISTGEAQLFDLGTDFHEKNNLIGKKKEEAGTLESAFDAYERSCRKYKRETMDITLDDDSVERFRELGYIQ